MRISFYTRRRIRRIMRPSGIVLLCAAAVWLVVHFWPNEERRVLKRLDRLAKNIEKDGTENYLSLALKAKNVAECFTDPCRFDVSRMGLTGNVDRDKINALVMGFHSDVSKVSIRILHRQVEFQGPDSAGLLVGAEMRGNLTDGEAFGERHVFECRLKKTDGQWTFVEVRMVDAPEE
jgi:hypothetical protein